MTKEQLIAGLYQVLTTKIANNRFFFARSLGFKSELELYQYFTDRDVKLLSGGQFLFGNKTGDKHNLVYFTVSSEEPQTYIPLYKKIIKVPLVSKLFFIRYGAIDGWDTIPFNTRVDGQVVVANIPRPNLEYFIFNGETLEPAIENDLISNFQPKNVLQLAQAKENRLGYLADYPTDAVAEVYANRFILDVTLGDHKKGMIDFDGVIQTADGVLHLLEAKEKDPAPNPNGTDFFGWDSRRLAWYLYIQHHTGLEALYIVRQINNQQDRQFVAWQYITLEDFAASATWLSESGGGGGSGTITAPITAFDSLDNLPL